VIVGTVCVGKTRTRSFASAMSGTTGCDGSHVGAERAQESSCGCGLDGGGMWVFKRSDVEEVVTACFDVAKLSQRRDTGDERVTDGCLARARERVLQLAGEVLQMEFDVEVGNEYGAGAWSVSTKVVTSLGPVLALMAECDGDTIA
jgi:hypothetical protein